MMKRFIDGPSIPTLCFSGAARGSPARKKFSGTSMEVVFGKPDKMFRLIGEALSPSLAGETFLKDFFLTECEDPAALLRRWSLRPGLPRGITVVHRPNELKLAECLKTADVVVTENHPVNAADIDAAPLLKL